MGTPRSQFPFELVGAYGTFANQGIYIQPIVITRIEDKNGMALFEVVPKTKDVISEEAAYVTVNLMQGVAEHGRVPDCATPGLERPIMYMKKWSQVILSIFEKPHSGRKTETTQNQSDGWFMGMVPNLVTGAWVGGEDRSIHFEEIAFDRVRPWLCPFGPCS